MVTLTLERRQVYQSYWDRMVVNPERLSEASAVAKKLLKSLPRYNAIAAITGVPAPVIMAMHERECGGNFRGALCNGELIIGTDKKTKLVPAGAGPWATFEAGAIWALAKYKGVQWDIPEISFTLNAFNGFGYDKYDEPSPYLYGGTNIQKRGKYVRDRVYDATVMDTQLGGLAVLEIILQLEPALHAQLGIDKTPVVLPPPPTITVPKDHVVVPPNVVPTPVPPAPGHYVTGAALVVTGIGMLLSQFYSSVSVFFHHLFGG